MSRKGSTGSSLGICNCWSLSVVSIASVVNSGSLTIAMGRVLYRYQDLLSPSVFNLWKVYVQHTVAKLRRSFADAEGPAQRHDAFKFAEAALGTQVRKNLSAVGPSFLFTRDSESGVANTYFDLFGSYTRQFDSNRNHRFCFAKIDRRRPGSGGQRVFSFSRFL